jgi:hypothetical protein
VCAAVAHGLCAESRAPDRSDASVHFAGGQRALLCAWRCLGVDKFRCRRHAGEVGIGAAGDQLGNMAYEYPTACGVLRLQKLGRHWAVQFEGSRRVAWPTAEAAAKAVARRETGLPTWDAAWQDVSDDLLDWRPIGDSL